MRDSFLQSVSLWRFPRSRMVIAEQVWHSENAALGWVFLCVFAFFFFFPFFFYNFFFFLLFIRQCVFYGTCKSASSRGITAAPGSVALNTGLCRKDSSSRSSSYIKQRSAHGHSGSASGSSQGAVLQLPFLSLDVCLKRTSKDFSQELQSEFSSL